MGMVHSPNVVNTGLVLSFDAANPRSFRGEPTTNTLPSPTINAYPTTGNGWGTYNTNQYGSGNFFSIGTVSSVSNNIVTMTSAHSLRTYDVMRPQTTGGGVTANTDYFIKKISSTQFSLHEYNSSQDGSQGYINSSTGTHKVYDSLANDTRVSINSTNFPTMWWGAPHLPNSGLVKELITRGFTHPDTQAVTDCIRLHYIRTDDVKDGMAYSVDATTTNGQPVTVSFYTRPTSAAGEGKSINYLVYNYGAVSPTYFSTNFTLGPPGVWQRQTYTFTAANENMISYWFSNSGGVYSWEWSNMQVEQKSYATAFVAGTRGTTNATGGGLVDLTSNGNHGELVNGPTYNSGNGGSIVFDGTNDSVNTSVDLRTNFSLECWVNYNVLNGFSFFGQGPTSTNQGLHIWNTSDSSIRFGMYANDTDFSSLSLAINNWYHFVFTYNHSSPYTKQMFLNGVEKTGTPQQTQAQYAGTGTLRIGAIYGSGNYAFANGKIAKVRIYNKILSSTEVLQNFEATRRLFGV